MSSTLPSADPSPKISQDYNEKPASVDVETKAVAPAAGPTFPEGGLRGWLTVAGGSMIVFCTFGAVQSFGVYQDYYTRVTLSEHTASEVSWIGSFQVFLLFALGLPVGKLFDEGYFRPVIAAGSLLYLFSFFMLSLTKQHQYYQTFLSQGLGSSLGGIIWPIMLNHLLNESAGFPWGVRAEAFLAMGFLFTSFWFMKTRLPGRRDRPNAKPVSIMVLFKDIPFLICIIGGFFVYWGLFFPFFYLQLYANVHGISRNLSLYTIPILNASSLFGRTIPSLAADRWGRFNVAIPMTMVSGLLIFAMFGATNVHGLIGFAIVYGFFSGAWMSLTAPVLTLFANSVDEVGIRIGFGMFAFSFALLTGNPISGALLESPKYLWGRPIVFNAVMILFGCVMLTISRHMIAKKKGTQWV
ncbi:hypothetical protein EWM64_g8040 [Hericium alpestre]|uniref:Major facilitator superfamily (MFS) profile domain-containing protein n=1 Tax=Hericium alpestre TaxID=135208 RepID=A0A4Y9ZMG3_9AGAM|nr:hypothetical protein EWM64_g8040 [Hericium alpestre]